MTTYHAESSRLTARDICVAAVLTALVFVATFVPRIPIPLGYAHLGDAVIFLSVLVVRRREAFTAACLGSVLSDLLGGFPIWAVPTFFIKLVMAWIVWRIAVDEDGCIAGRGRCLLGFLASSVWMAVAYTLFGAGLYDSLAAGLASAPGLFLEGAFNTIVALLALPVVQRLPQF